MPKQSDITRCSAYELKKYMEDYDLSSSEAARELQTSSSTVTNWLRKDNVPKFVLAIEAIRSRRENRNGGDQILMAVGDRAKLQVLSDMAEQMSVRCTRWDKTDLV